jgi:hypothetical protein
MVIEMLKFSSTLLDYRLAESREEYRIENSNQSKNIISGACIPMKSKYQGQIK